MVNKISVVNGTSLILLMVMLLRAGINYLMDVLFTMTLTTTVMVKVCCMACKKWETITTISTKAMVRKKAA